MSPRVMNRPWSKKICVELKNSSFFDKYALNFWWPKLIDYDTKSVSWWKCLFILPRLFLLLALHVRAILTLILICFSFLSHALISLSLRSNQYQWNCERFPSLSSLFVCFHNESSFPIVGSNLITPTKHKTR